MKNLSFATSLFFLLFTTASCDDELSKNDELNDNSNFESLIASLDSLNYKYIATSTRSYDLSNPVEEQLEAGSIAVTSADAVGGMIGQAWGGQIGGFIGGAVTGGNPFGYWLGYGFGRQFMPYILGATASIIVEATCTYSRVMSPEDYLRFGIRGQFFDKVNDLSSETVFDLSVMGFDNDSIGYYHNYIIDQVYNTIDYNELFIGNQVNTDYLYDQAIKVGSKILKEDYSPFLEKQFKRQMLDAFEEMDKYGKKYIDGELNLNQLYDNHKELLVNKFGFDAKETNKYLTIQKKTLKAIYSIDKEDLNSYSNDFAKVVKESNLNINEKNSILSNTQLMINSQLLWTNNNNANE